MATPWAVWSPAAAVSGSSVVSSLQERTRSSARASVVSLPVSAFFGYRGGLPRGVVTDNGSLSARQRSPGRDKGRGRTAGRRAAVSVSAVAFPVDLSAPAVQAGKWVLRLLSFYALLKLGVAKEPNGGVIDNAQGFLAKKLFGDSEKKKDKEARQATVKWKESTKGTLVRKLRVPSVSQGRKLLQSIASVLSQDDLFIDVASHKGCQVRRETAHSDSVCCYNVRALFDELPTPHLELEITVFPAGPLTSLEYQKAQKLESVLRQGNSI